MAKVTITFEDIDGQVESEIVFDPPLFTEDDRLTKAQYLAMLAQNTVEAAASSTEVLEVVGAGDDYCDE